MKYSRTLIVLALSLALAQDSLCQSPGDLLDKAWQLRLTQRDSSSMLARLALQRGEEHNLDSILVQAQFLLAWNIQLSGDNPGAIRAFKNLRDLDQIEFNDDWYIRSSGLIGNLYTNLGDFDSAMVYLLEYDQLVDKYWGSDHHEAKLQLAELYRAMGRTADSDMLKKEAIERARAGDNELGLITSLYYFLDDHKYNLGDSEYMPFLNEYLDLIGKEGSDGMVDYAHGNMLFLGMSDEDKIRTLRRAVADQEMRNRSRGSLFLSSQLIDAFLEGSLYDSARTYAQQALATALDLNDPGFTADMLSAIAVSSEALGDYQTALDYFRKYHSHRDSLKDVVMAKNLDELRLGYETAEKERMLAQQNVNLQLRTNERNMLIIGLVTTLILGLMITLYLIQKKRTSDRIVEKDKRLRESRIFELEQEKKLLSLKAMMEGEEKERRRLAHDLHDGLGGLLSSLAAQASTLAADNNDDNVKQVLKHLEGLADSAKDEVRRISHNLAPSALELEHLSEAISDLKQQWIQNGTTVNYQWNGNREIDLEYQSAIYIYRIVQELVSNALKHSRANHIDVQISVHPGELNLVVEDDGIGFDHSRVESKKGIGLSSARSRVEYLNGKMEIDSKKDVGSSIVVRIPLDN